MLVPFSPSSPSFAPLSSSLSLSSLSTLPLLFPLSSFLSLSLLSPPFLSFSPLLPLSLSSLPLISPLLPLSLLPSSHFPSLASLPLLRTLLNIKHRMTDFQERILFSDKHSQQHVVTKFGPEGHPNHVSVDKVYTHKVHMYILRTTHFESTFLKKPCKGTV